MDVFEFALKMELDGEKYYRDLANRVQYEELKIVLENLAEDEQRHYQIILLAQNQRLQPIEGNPTLSKVKNVFTCTDAHKLALNNKDFIVKLKDEQSDLYRAALEKEKESVRLYQKLKENSKNTEEETVFTTLMHEEEKHVEVIDNIIDMLNHVNDWVEAAEFNHKDTY